MTRKTSKSAAQLIARREHKLTEQATGERHARRLKAVARTAAQLAREDAGLYASVAELSTYALTLVDAAYRARQALAQGKDPKPYYRRARAVASIFGAELVDRGDADGMVVGLKFSSGRYTSGAENIFYVA